MRATRMSGFWFESFPRAALEGLESESKMSRLNDFFVLRDGLRRSHAVTNGETRKQAD